MKTVFRMIWIVLRDNRGELEIPDDVIMDLARHFLPRVVEFFSSEEGKAEFEKWKAEQKEKSEDESSL